MLPFERPTRRGECYVAEFMPDHALPCPGCGRQSVFPVKSFAKTFGPAASAEELMTRVQQKVQGDPVWALGVYRAFGTGKFRAVRVDAHVELPDMSEVAHRIATG